MKTDAKRPGLLRSRFHPRDLIFLLAGGGLLFQAGAQAPMAPLKPPNPLPPLASSQLAENAAAASGDRAASTGSTDVEGACMATVEP
jgi:hypothetical protein